MLHSQSASTDYLSHTENFGDEGELSEWTLLRALAGTVNQGKFEQAFTNAVDVLPRLRGAVQVKALAAAGMVAFCLQVSVIALFISLYLYLLSIPFLTLAF